jgi:hypothetical protein
MTRIRFDGCDLSRSLRHPGHPSVRISLAESLGEDEVGIRLREVMEQEEVALEQVESATAKLLAEQVESEF